MAHSVASFLVARAGLFPFPPVKLDCAPALGGKSKTKRNASVSIPKLRLLAKLSPGFCSISASFSEAGIDKFYLYYINLSML
jgi:hypothetical protein